MSGGDSSESSAHVTHYKQSLNTQIKDVQKRIQRHREEHLAIVGPYGTIADLNSRQQSLAGQLRAMQFVIDHHHMVRRELVGGSISVELDEARCMKRYASAKQANELAKQQIDMLESDLARLISVRDQPYPSFSDVSELQAKCASLDDHIRDLEMEIAATMGNKDSHFAIQNEAVSVINDLIDNLKRVESHYAKLCDSKMESLSRLMELYEKKLKLYKTQREYLDEFGDAENGFHMDFESGDIEEDKRGLKNLHRDLKFCDEARNACISRFDELTNILSTIHV